MEEVYGIKYTRPEVILLQDSGVGVAEIAARTCYDSFDNSENICVQDFDKVSEPGTLDEAEYLVRTIKEVNDIENSDLLNSLAWVHHHHSIIEHATVSFLVKGTSRGVLQEHARHRLQAISVRSTRYTMSSVINAFMASKADQQSKEWFSTKLQSMNMFIIKGEEEVLEISHMYEKLQYQYITLGHDEFIQISIAKSSQVLIKMAQTADDLFKVLQSGAKKRNVGDAFKWIVTDNWKVDMVITFNIRSLKNYFDLRDSGAAYFQIRFLAQAIKEATPLKYLKLIDKSFKV